ncbi:MAG: type II toxin-antitoxin system RelE/ParE family toxin [Nanoarchaeota archaeon]
MYSLEFRDSVEKTLQKLAKRNPKQLEIIHKKIQEILLTPQSYKNLRAPMQYLKRVHIDKSFVLVFSINEETKTVVIEDFDHHDKIYL